MALAHTNGPMATLTQGSGPKTPCTASVLTNGKMDVSTRAIGRKTSCTAKVCTPGLMDENTTETMRMIRKTELAPSTGPMVASIKAAGATENNTVRLYSLRLTRRAARASGRMANVWGGPARMGNPIVI